MDAPRYIPAAEYLARSKGHQHEWAHHYDGPDDEWWECVTCHAVSPA